MNEIAVIIVGQSEAAIPSLISFNILGPGFVSWAVFETRASEAACYHRLPLENIRMPSNNLKRLVKRRSRP